MIIQLMVTCQPKGKSHLPQDHTYNDYVEKMREETEFEFTFNLKYAECVRSEVKDMYSIVLQNVIHWT